MDANEAECECDGTKCLEQCRCKTYRSRISTPECNQCNCDAIKCLEQCSCKTYRSKISTPECNQCNCDAVKCLEQCSCKTYRSKIRTPEPNQCNCDAIKCLAQCSCKTHDAKISTQDYVRDADCQCKLTDSKLQNICIAYQDALYKKISQEKKVARHDSRDSQLMCTCSSIRSMPCEEKCRCSGDTTYQKTRDNARFATHLVQQSHHECAFTKSVRRRGSADFQLMCICPSMQNAPSKEKCHCNSTSGTHFQKTTDKVRPVANLNQQSHHVCAAKKTVTKRGLADSQLMCVCSSLQNAPCKEKCRCTSIGDTALQKTIDNKVKPITNVNQRPYLSQPPHQISAKTTIGRRGSADSQLMCICSSLQNAPCNEKCPCSSTGDTTYQKTSDRVAVGQQQSHHVCAAKKSVYRRCSADSQLMCLCRSIQNELDKLKSRCSGVCNDVAKSLQIQGRYNVTDGTFYQKVSKQQDDKGIKKQPNISARYSNSKEMECHCNSIQDLWNRRNQLGVPITSSHSVCECNSMTTGNVRSDERDFIDNNEMLPCDCNPNKLEKECLCGSKCSEIRSKFKMEEGQRTSYNKLKDEEMQKTSYHKEGVQNISKDDDLKNLKNVPSCTCSRNKSEIINRLASISEDAAQDTFSDSGIKKAICRCVPDVTESRCQCKSFIEGISNLLTAGRRSIQGDRPCDCDPTKIESKCRCSSSSTYKQGGDGQCLCLGESRPQSKCRCVTSGVQSVKNTQDIISEEKSKHSGAGPYSSAVTRTSTESKAPSRTSRTSKHDGTTPCYCSVGKIRSKCQCLSTQPCDCNPNKIQSECRCSSGVTHISTEIKAPSRTSKHDGTTPCYCSVGKMRSKCQCLSTQPCDCNPNKIQPECRCSSGATHNLRETPNEPTKQESPCYCSTGKIRSKCQCISSQSYRNDGNRIQSKGRSNSEIIQNVTNLQSKAHSKASKDDSVVPCKCSIDSTRSKCPCIPAPGDFKNKETIESKKRSNSGKTQNVSNKLQSKAPDKTNVHDGPCGCILSKLFSKCFCKPSLVCDSKTERTSTTDLPGQNFPDKLKFQPQSTNKYAGAAPTKPQPMPFTNIHQPYAFKPKFESVTPRYYGDNFVKPPMNFTQNYMNMLQKRREMERFQYANCQPRSCLHTIICGIQCQVRKLAQRIEDTLEFHLRSESVIKNRITQKINSLKDEMMLSNRFCIDVVKNMTNSFRNDATCFCS